MSVYIFTDCFDANANARQIMRWDKIFKIPVYCFPVKKSIEVSFCVLDMHYAGELPITIEKTGLPDIIVGNIAPREEKKYPNGAPFCYAYSKDGTLIIGTPDTFVLPLKEGVVKDVYETDAYHVCKSAGLSEDQALRISNSQFRSLDYVPLLAFWILTREIPATAAHINPSKFDNEIGFIDCFGNCKSTVRKSDFPTNSLSELQNETIELSNGKDSFQHYRRLKDVPVGETGITEGSSGDGYLEIVVQGDSASIIWDIKLGEKALTIPVFEEV